jgi:hypothetical protein
MHVRSTKVSSDNKVRVLCVSCVIDKDCGGDSKARLLFGEQHVCEDSLLPRPLVALVPIKHLQPSSVMFMASPACRTFLR